MEGLECLERWCRGMFQHNLNRSTRVILRENPGSQLEGSCAVLRPRHHRDKLLDDVQRALFLLIKG